VSTPDERLSALGVELPEVAKPVGNYTPAVRSGNYVHTSGQLPLVRGELRSPGKVGGEVTLEEGVELARICALNAIAAVRAELDDDLTRVVRIVKVNGFVASTPDFHAQPQVLNGASDLLAEVFGEAGVHARAAVGVVALPRDAAVEVELIVEVS
jgi:enamine deaminase RidA (YjgF/YER057c/UK114 family)